MLVQVHTHLPLFLILVTLHLERLSINKIPTHDDGARLQVGQDFVGKQAVWAPAAYQLGSSPGILSLQICILTDLLQIPLFVSILWKPMFVEY